MTLLTRTFPIAGIVALSMTTAVLAFDRQTTDALKACHDYLWDVPEFAELPNAALSVWPASSNGGLTKIYWVVDWTDPDIRAAGQCEYSGDEVIGYERF
ncbi:hypothetical protein [Marivita hallyeonensis]|uniref:Uncharacterized protein n=1 Tax=Marivita hallyeonensis TaxID=996342 RepID=A0A1M5MZA5_9RHOB|nr:hypothetical protein [Marivita hallyeonensis]SHG82535.1 hypothetical protein SAMN05443551_0710 [Marivita hallyeonensis]